MPAAPGIEVMARLAEFRAEIGKLAEPVIPGVRAEILRAAEILVTDVEQMAPGLM